MSELPVFKFALREDLKDKKEFLPTKGEPFATGYDVSSAPLNKKPIIIKPHEYFRIPLGFNMICPAGWWCFLLPRSSSFLKRNISALYGVIDQDYYNEVSFVGQYQPNKNEEKDLIIEYGARIGQLIPFKIQEMVVRKISNEEFKSITTTKKTYRKGGFGSTDM